MNDDWHWLLVSKWLEGYDGRDSRGLPKRLYISGKYERIARNFLALAIDRQVKLPWRVANKLARLLTSEDDGFDAYFGAHRKFDIVNRKPGRVPETKRDMFLFDEIQKGIQSGEKVEAVIAGVSEKYGVGRSELFRVKKELERKHIMLPFLTQAGAGVVGGSPDDGHEYGSLQRWSPINASD